METLFLLAAERNSYLEVNHILFFHFCVFVIMLPRCRYCVGVCLPLVDSIRKHTSAREVRYMECLLENFNLFTPHLPQARESY
jgi:uncharacterized membrane protein